MKPQNLEYKKKYKRTGNKPNKVVYMGREGCKYWFFQYIKAGKEEKLGNRFWMSESQIEKLIEEI